MRDAERQYIDERSETDAHFQPICTEDKVDIFNRQILREVFDSQRAIYPHKKLARFSLAAEFYKNAYIQPRIRHWGDKRFPEMYVKEFIAQKVVPRFLPDRNAITYLQGVVGTGKTALINYLISVHGRQLVDKNLIFFVRVNLEIGEKRLANVQAADSLPDILYKIVAKTHKVLSQFNDLFDSVSAEEKYESKVAITNLEGAIHQYDQSTDGDAQALHDMMRTFTEALGMIKRISGRRLLLIVDNVDYVTHLRERLIFNNPPRVGDEKISNLVIELVKYFAQRGTPVSNCGLHLLVVLRKSTYRILTAIGGTSLREIHPTLLDQCYEIEDISPQAVVDSRISLLKLYGRHFKKAGELGKAANIEKLCGRLDIYMRGKYSREQLPLLLRLSNYRLRDLVHFLCNAPWLNHKMCDDEDTLLERFTDNRTIGLITYMLNNNRRFSQLRCHFPNIYLCNPISESDSENTAEFPHTYWLKRLILEFVAAQEREGGSVRPNQIIDLFSNRDRTLGQGYYAEKLVRIILGSMSEANGSNLLEAERQRHPDYPDRHIIATVRLTERGQECVSGLFDTFNYLRLVVDDHVLPLPRSLRRSVFNFAQFPSDYGHLATLADYRTLAAENIATKARQVMLFLMVLEISLAFEQEKYRPVFQQLRTSGVPVPDIKKASTTVLSHLGKLAAMFPNAFTIDEFVMEAKSFRNLVLNELRGSYSDV